MRVAIATNFYVPELGMNTYFLCRGLGRLGIDVVLFASKKYGKKKPSNIFKSRELEEPFKVVKIDTLFNIANVPFMGNIAARVRQEHERKPFDILQTEDAYQLYSLAMASLSNSMRTPLVLRHDLAEPPTVEPYRTTFKIVEGIVSRRVVDACATAIVPTPAAGMYLSRLKPNLRVNLIPFGVDTEVFRPRNTTSVNKDFNVLTVARLIPAKGLAELFDAFAMFRKSHPNATLTVIGRGTMKEWLLRRITQLDLVGAVRFEYFVRHDLMPSFYNFCDMFVLPSYEETPGLAILEAMASGKPIVATDIPGIRDSVDNGVSGILVPPRDPSALLSAMNRVHDEVVEGSCRLGENARAKAVNSLSWDVVCSATRNVYERLQSD